MIRSKPFTECHSTVDPASFMKGCVDTMCECLGTDTDSEECRCQALTHYVTQCLEKNPEAPISDWRIVAKCCKLDCCRKYHESFMTVYQVCVVCH